MKKNFLGLMATGFSTVALVSLVLVYPAWAADDADGISVGNAPSSTSTTKVKSKTAAVPVGSTTVGSSAPAAAAPAVATTPSTPTPAPAANADATSPDSIKSGNLTFSHPHLSSSGDRLDLYFTIKNDGKGDERLGGAESTWTTGDIVLVSKDKGGKEQEGPIAVVIPAGKSVEFSSSDMWLRVKKADKEPKNPTVFPITFYFRSSPNTTLKISMKGQSTGSSILNWFEK
jgi:copper(I)-binding protein